VARRYGVALMYLFGSRAAVGAARLRGHPVAADDPLADLDLAVVFREGLPAVPRRPAVYAGLYGDLADLFGPLRLDLVFAQETHVVFQGEIIKGICIYAVDENVKTDYEIAVARYAADFRPVLERALAEALEEV